MSEDLEGMIKRTRRVIRERGHDRASVGGQEAAIPPGFADRATSRSSPSPAKSSGRNRPCCGLAESG